MKYRFDQIAINSTVKKKPIDADKEHYIGLEHLDSDCLIVSRMGRRGNSYWGKTFNAERRYIVR